MNYSEMSDHEINMRMTSVLYGCEEWQVSESNMSFYHCGIDGSGFYEVEVIDYCGSWANVGDIIQAYSIQLFKLQPKDKLWIAKGYIGERVSFSRHTVEHENPRRAAAIVWLMMKDEENE